MLAYWSLFLTPALLALHRRYHPNVVWWLVGSAIALAIGLRYQVGGDWGSYLRYLDTSSRLTLLEIVSGREPGYYLVNWFASQLEAGVWLVNLICGAIFTAGLIRFVRRLPDPMLALTIAVPYMVTVVAMGYTRQAVAFGLLLWALVYLQDRRTTAFIITMAVAATFHQSAVVMLPLAALANSRQRLWNLVWVGVTTLVIFVAFLGEQRADHLWGAYVESDYSQKSQGGPIRVLMNCIPAGLFLLFYRKIPMYKEDKALWFWVAVFSLAMMPLVLQAPTAVDRIALYFMTMQLVVWPYVPLLFVRSQRYLIRISILGFYAFVMFVWLNFAVNAKSWLPYQLSFLQ